MLVLMDKKLCYSFYRANTVKNVANDGNEMSAQRTIFAQIKAFNANRRVPRWFFDPLNSILRSILVYNARRMRKDDFWANQSF